MWLHNKTTHYRVFMECLLSHWLQHSWTLSRISSECLGFLFLHVVEWRLTQTWNMSKPQALDQLESRFSVNEYGTIRVGLVQWPFPSHSSSSHLHSSSISDNRWSPLLLGASKVSSWLVNSSAILASSELARWSSKRTNRKTKHGLLKDLVLSVPVVMTGSCG